MAITIPTNILNLYYLSVKRIFNDSSAYLSPYSVYYSDCSDLLLLYYLDNDNSDF